jgi:chromosome segregation ATPase
MLKLVGENVALRKKLKVTRASRNSIQSKLQSAKARINRLLAKIERLTKEQQDLERECKIADQQINDLLEERAFLRKRVKELEEC